MSDFRFCTVKSAAAMTTPTATETWMSRPRAPVRVSTVPPSVRAPEPMSEGIIRDTAHQTTRTSAVVLTRVLAASHHVMSPKRRLIPWTGSSRLGSGFSLGQAKWIPPCTTNARTEPSRAAATSGTMSIMLAVVASTRTSIATAGSGSSTMAAARTSTPDSSRYPAAMTVGAVRAIAAMAAQDDRSWVRGLLPWSLASLSFLGLGASVFS